MTGEDQVVFVYTTWPDAGAAGKAGAELVRDQLAACVNILAPMTSVYAWEGKVEESIEVPMLIKTTSRLVDAVAAAVRQLHPYDLPAIAALPIVGGDQAFLGWIRDQTAGAGTIPVTRP